MPRPDWMPVWAWDQYLEYLDEIRASDWVPFSDLPISVSDRIAFFERIVFCKDSETVWTSINRRKKTPKNVLRSHNNVAYVLEWSLQAWHTYSEQCALPAFERKRRGISIENTAKRLETELRTLHRLSSEIQPGLPPEFASVDYERMVADLASLKKCAATWKASEPLFKKPTSNNSHRRHFVAKTAEVFDHFHAQWLLNATAALANCLWPEERRLAHTDVRTIMRGANL